MLLQRKRSELHTLCCSCPPQEVLADIVMQASVISSVSEQVMADATADFSVECRRWDLEAMLQLTEQNLVMETAVSDMGFAAESQWSPFHDMALHLFPRQLEAN